MKWFCRHDWSAWSEMVNTYNSPRQFRACIKCNKVAHRGVAINGNYVNTTAWNSTPELLMPAALEQKK